MGTLDEVNAMKREGRTDAEISSMLRQRGLTDREIGLAMSQQKIKEAVHGDDEYQSEPAQGQSVPETSPSTQEYNQMSPSLMSPPQADQYEPAVPAPEAQQEAPAAYPEYQSYSQQPQAAYDGQQYAPSAGFGSDVITEIADQVVAEKLTPLLGAMDKILDMKSTVDAQLKYMDERLKRIEKIIDRLQLSVLQRVGEYVSNVEDIKQELQETQKTFKALVDRKQ